MIPFRKILPLCLILLSACQTNKTSLVSLVNPLIGTSPATTPGATRNQGDHVDNGQTIPAVTAPFAMTQWTPQTRDTEKKCLAPFYFLDEKLQGIRATHWTSGSCVQDYGSFTLMPISGTFAWLPNQRSATYLMDTVSLSPAYCSLNIPDHKVTTEITSTERCGILRFTWKNPDHPAIIIDVNSDEGEGFLRIDPERREIVAGNPVHRIYNGSGKPAGFSGYVVMQFDCDFEKFGIYSGTECFDDSLETGNRRQSGGYVFLSLSDEMVTHVKMGTSFTSVENARQNLEAEIPDWDFDQTRTSLEDSWNRLLGTIKVSGGSKTDQVKFYTSLYHSCIHPRLYSDVNGSYPAFGGAPSIMKADGFNYYNDFSAWDTYRAQMPLLSLLAPGAYLDMVRSWIKMAEQGGWLPIFPMWNSYTSAMIGDHGISIIGDAIMKGFDPGLEAAWKAMIKNATEMPDSLSYIDGKGRRALISYLQYGYVPLEDEVPFAFHRREQVSRTLEYAYDDWVLSQVAAKLGKTAEAEILAQRAKNYVNVFDPQKGWVCGRFADGRFTGDFVADRHMSYITEGSPMHYTWYVPHDVPGLMGLMGGRDLFYGKLETFINDRKYWHGNEPSHHIPYLFNYAGRWDKTQEVVKMILESEYTAEPGGLSGNDDAGQMSAWYAFSAIGFYPVCPGSNQYQLSSPIFDKVEIAPDPQWYPGGKLTLLAKENKPGRIFTSATIRGEELNGILTHEQIQKGGKIIFR